MSQIKNLTPHAINIIDPCCCEYNPRTRSYSLNSEIVILQTIEPEGGNIPRCATSEVEQSPIDGIPTISLEFGKVENLPAQESDTWLIVSAIVANAGRAIGRTDLLIPARMVRDVAGNIVGCLAFARG